MAVWRINRWFGGLSTGSKRGVDGSFTFGQGLDFRSDPDLLQANYAMSKNSSTNVTGLPKWFVQNGTVYYAYADDGKIHSNAGSWASLRTVGNSSGQGLEIFNDYLYYAQNAQLGRYGVLSGAPAFTDNYQTLDTDTLWHPCKVFLNKLCVGHGRKLATLDSSGTWTSAAITLPIDWKIKCLEVRGDFLYIGAWKGTAITDYEIGALFAWDGTTTTWNTVEFINESGVNSLFNQNDGLYISAGTRGNLYQLAGGKFVKIKRVPLIGAGKYAEIFPGAMTGFNGILHFGLAGVTDSTTVYQGVYTWGQVEKNYPMVLNFDYPVSTGTVTGTGVKIGAVYGASPTKLFVGWKDGANYGIDLISTSTTQTTVILESIIFDANRPTVSKLFKEIRLVYKPFTASESITVKYKADRDTSFTTLTSSAETLDVTNKYDCYPFIDATNGGFTRAKELQLRLELNNGAQLVEASVEFEEEEN